MGEHSRGGTFAAAEHKLVINPPGFVGDQFTFFRHVHIARDALSDINDPKPLSASSIANLSSRSGRSSQSEKRFQRLANVPGFPAMVLS